MLTSEIISKFELYLDDGTELSSSEELALANKIYYKILDSKAWEILKKEWSTTTNGTNNLTLPTDFAYFVNNYNYTDNSQNNDINSNPKIIFVNNSPYKLVNWSDRKQYSSSGGYAYVDLAAGKLYFTDTPDSGLSVSADYIYTPAALTLSTSPIFPERFQHAIYHGMASEDYIIQQSNKAESYANENRALYKEFLDAMSLWNSKFYNN